jgi:DNA polymerase I
VDKLLDWVSQTLELEIKPERQYARILFTEAMKRYAGLLQDGSLDIVGLEVVRGDWSEIAKQVQEQVLRSVLRDRSPDEAVAKVRLTVKKLRESRVPILDLTIRKSLTKPVQEYAVRAPHIEVAKKLIKEGWDVGAGDQVAYVIIKGPGKLYQKAEPFTRVTPKQVDVDYYIQNQIKPAAMRILGGLGVSEKQLDA